MKVLFFCDGPMKHNHFKAESVPSEVHIQFTDHRVAIYECMHHETKTGNIKYTHATDVRKHQNQLVKMR